MRAQCLTLITESYRRRLRFVVRERDGYGFGRWSLVENSRQTGTQFSIRVVSGVVTVPLEIVYVFIHRNAHYYKGFYRGMQRRSRRVRQTETDGEKMCYENATHWISHGSFTLWTPVRVRITRSVCCAPYLYAGLSDVVNLFFLFQVEAEWDRTFIERVWIFAEIDKKPFPFRIIY